MYSCTKKVSIIGGDGMAESETLTFGVEEAGRLLGISRNSAYEAVRRNELPVIRVGRRLLIPRAALQRLLDEAGMPFPKASATRPTFASRLHSVEIESENA